MGPLRACRVGLRHGTAAGRPRDRAGRSRPPRGSRHRHRPRHRPARAMTPERTPRHPLAGLVTVMWHYVRRASDGVAVGATWVEPDAFDAQLDAIANSRTVVDWPAVAEALDGGRPLPPDPALLTFDDGLADHARTVVPLLIRRGWSGVFFVLARQTGEPLTVGHAIHVLLAELGEDGLAAAVVDGLAPGDAAT